MKGVVECELTSGLILDISMKSNTDKNQIIKKGSDF